MKWDAISNALADVSSNFKRWAPKHIASFCWTAHRQNILGHSESGVCPNCTMEKEMPSHIVQCTHTPTTGTYLKGIISLVELLRQVDTDPVLLDTINYFFKILGATTFILPKNAPDLRPYRLLTEQAFIW
eukprot:7861172-Ditylum_brightwellii.AAC.1